MNKVHIPNKIHAHVSKFYCNYGYIVLPSTKKMSLSSIYTGSLADHHSSLTNDDFFGDRHSAVSTAFEWMAYGYILFHCKL